MNELLNKLILSIVLEEKNLIMHGLASYCVYYYCI
jgi:hypothetical protein